MMNQLNLHTLDLNFQSTPRAIASYLLPHPEGGVLIESGPGSTVETLTKRLAAHDLTPADISDVLLTHIHLDHAGAAGWLAKQGATIHVHHIGAPHMLNPEKLIASATRIYGDQMDELWGDFLPVPADKLNILHDNDVIEIHDLAFRALDTPGHAYHHMSYIIDQVCFSGDVGGVRIPFPDAHYLQVPMPPPGLHLEKWRESIHRLQQEDLQVIAPTHFGIHTNLEQHFQELLETIDRVENWMERVMQQDPALEELREAFKTWTWDQARDAGLEDDVIASYQQANPPGMSADGLLRYWRKHRQGDSG